MKILMLLLLSILSINLVYALTFQYSGDTEHSSSQENVDSAVTDSNNSPSAPSDLSNVPKGTYGLLTVVDFEGMSVTVANHKYILSPDVKIRVGDSIINFDELELLHKKRVKIIFVPATNTVIKIISPAIPNFQDMRG